MHAGRNCSRIRYIGLLFSRSENLQANLYQFSTLLVQLCHHLVTQPRISTTQPYIPDLNDIDIKQLQADLRRSAGFIKQNIKFLSTNSLDTKAKGNTWFCLPLLKRPTTISHQQRQTAILRILGACSKYDYAATWKQTRRIGNATLFNRSGAFRTWKEQPCSSTIIVTGDIGSGKSVLLANIVDDIHLLGQSTDTSVAYFFCQADVPESLRARTIIGSLVHQLLSTSPDLTSLVAFFNNSGGSVRYEAILKLVHHALPLGHKAYFVLDGLDRCEEVEIREVVQQLQWFQKQFTLLWCVSLRENSGVLDLASKFASPNTVPIYKDKQDIRLFIEAEVERILRDKIPKLVLGSATLIDDVQNALLTQCKGRFLWVTLQLAILSSLETAQEFQHALSSLPEELSDIYPRLLQPLAETHRPYHTFMLQLIAVAYRPLTIHQLQEALSIILGTSRSRSTDLKEVASALNSLGSVIVIDEEESTVHLIHDSLRQFLLSHPMMTSKEETFSNDAHASMLDIAVTYLSYSDLANPSSTDIGSQSPNLASPPLICSLAPCCSWLQNTVFKLFGSRKQSNLYVGEKPNDIELREIPPPRTSEGPSFLSYAKAYWRYHTLQIKRLTPAAATVLPRLVSRELDGTDDCEKDARTLLFWAFESGDSDFKALLVDPKSGESSREVDDVLIKAASGGCDVVVKLLLRHFGHILQGGINDALQKASSQGRQHIVRLLLGSATSEADLGNAALRALDGAASGGHDEVISTLLDFVRSKEHIPTTESSLIDTQIISALTLAAANGHISAMQHLLSFATSSTLPTYLNTPDTNGYTPLHHASLHPNLSAAALLLSHGADPNAKTTCGAATPLHTHLDQPTVSLALLRTLLACGADVNAQNSRGETPLHTAVERGHTAAAQLLVAHDAILGWRAVDGQTPLHDAAAAGFTDIVEMLCRAGAYVGGRNSNGWTPLHCAVESGDEGVVRVLLAYGAEWGKRDRGGRTALERARGAGHVGVALLLREYCEEEEDVGRG